MLTPPPPDHSPFSATVSFHATSGMYESTEPRLAPLLALQYVPAASLNSVPPTATLRQGVLASTAIPGVYQPVGLGKRTLIDGGAHSTTNLDLAVKGGCELVICVAPMAFDTAEPPGPLRQLVRRIPARQLAGEVDFARRRDVQVLMIRPDAQELGIHGLNLMRPDGLDRIARAAYEATARMLQTDRFKEALAA